MENAIYSKFPLGNLLKGRMLSIAELQDRLMIETASRFDAILHGGTAIWRVYGGKRFSFDLDFYHGDPKAMLEFFEKSEGLRPARSKVTGTGVCYMRFDEGPVSAEINISPPFSEKKGTDGEFHLVGGDTIVVRTLTESELLREKIDAYINRRKARDLYDIFYLLGIADSEKASAELQRLSPLLNEPPKDFSGLRELILLGKSPDFETLARKVRMHAKD